MRFAPKGTKLARPRRRTRPIFARETASRSTARCVGEESDSAPGHQKLSPGEYRRAQHRINVRNSEPGLDRVRTPGAERASEIAMALPATHCDVRGESNRRQTGHDIRELKRYRYQLTCLGRCFAGYRLVLTCPPRWYPTLISVAKSFAPQPLRPGGRLPNLSRKLTRFRVLPWLSTPGRLCVDLASPELVSLAKSFAARSCAI